MSQKEFILKYLMKYKNKWCNGWKMTNEGRIMSHTGRICDLRKEGYHILNEKRYDKKTKLYHTFYILVI